MKMIIDSFFSLSAVTISNCPKATLDRVSKEMLPFVIEKEDALTKYEFYINVHTSNSNDLKVCDNTLDLYFTDEKFLFNSLRKAIREALYIPLEEIGFRRIHASCAKSSDGVVMFLGYKRSGKTSTASGLTMYEDYSFIDGDVAFYSPKFNYLIGWPTAIGLRREARRILNLEYSPCENSDDMGWYWPSEFADRGFKIDCGGVVNAICFPKYDFESNTYVFEKITDKDIIINKILEHVHFDELSKESIWHFKPLSYDEYSKPFFDVDLSNVLTFSAITNGLSKENINLISKFIKMKGLEL